MKIGKFRVRRKALSPVIATLLMVAIAVAAAIITYVWSMGLLGGLMGTGGAQTKEQLIIEVYNWKTGTLNYTVRNVGSANVEIAATYLEGVAQTVTGDTIISVGSSKGQSFTPTGVGTLSEGASYVLKLVTKTGATFTFSAVKGRAG